MTKTMVPRGRSNNSKRVGNSSKGGHSAGRWSERPGKMHRVQRAGAIRPGDHVLGCQIIHRQTKRAKFHRAPIISGKMMNREETLNHVRSKQNIVKVKWSGKN
jgi:MOSC domain-containing protein YiiM